jgi:hypothetical protein
MAWRGLSAMLAFTRLAVGPMMFAVLVLLLFIPVLTGLVMPCGMMAIRAS